MGTQHSSTAGCAWHCPAMGKALCTGVMPVAGSPVLVGRGAELAIVRRLVDAVQRGNGATLLVTGEAGIGKSRLVAEVAVRAARAGLSVLTGRAVQGGGTYRAVAEALARPLREEWCDSAQLRPYRTVLRRLATGWAGTDEGADPGYDLWLDPTVALGEGVLAVLRHLPGGAGCVLLLEDLHWADADTLDLVCYLANTVSSAPVLLALTARDDVTVPAVSRMTSQPAVTKLALARLDLGAVGALAAACRGGEPLPEPQLGQLMARSEGLPLLVEELLDPGDQSSRVPPTLADLVARRLAALSDIQRPVVDAAAVVGGDPDWRLLGAVIGVSDATVLDALRSAAQAGLLTVEGEQLRWRHALSREAVLATLLPPERAALAARAAQALDERAEPDDRRAAAELFLVAGQAQRAAEIFIQLARRDAARGALRSADELLAKAASTGRFTGTVATERVQVLRMLGRVVEALDVGAAALRTNDVIGQEHAELCLRLAHAAVDGGQWATAEGYLERAGRPADPRCLVLAAHAAFGAGDVARSTVLARAAVRAAKRHGRPENLCEALIVFANNVFGKDPVATGSALHRAAQIAYEHGLIPWQVEALSRLGVSSMSRRTPKLRPWRQPGNSPLRWACCPTRSESTWSGSS